jgi:catechol 2,3-dioxygenase-like lactoylglutathione lyase family enzyme
MSDPRLLLAIPVLPALSIEETLAFYEGRLGFRRYIDSTEYAGVELDGQQIHFWLCHDANVPENSSCRINVAGVDALYGRFLAAGVVGEDDAPEEKPWGFREFAVKDPSGNLVWFAEEIPGWVEE